MNKISQITFTKTNKSKYFKPITMHYEQNGRKKQWDIVGSHDSVAVVIYNATRQTVVLVKQFRPAIYHSAIARTGCEEANAEKHPTSLGVTLELCSGIVDKQLPLEQVAKEEVFEECGYDVPLGNFERVQSYRSSPGVTGSQQTLFYCQVTNDMRKSSGGGINNELIEVVELSVPEVETYISKNDVNSPASLLSGLQWFLRNKL